MHVVLGNTLGSIRNLFFFDEVSLFKKIVSILEKNKTFTQSNSMNAV